MRYGLKIGDIIIVGIRGSGNYSYMGRVMGEGGPRSILFEGCPAIFMLGRDGGGHDCDGILKYDCGHYLEAGERFVKVNQVEI